MNNKSFLKYIGVLFTSFIYTACAPNLVQKAENKTVLNSYNTSTDTLNSAKTKWAMFYTDTYLKALIDTALKNNQEYNIILQEISIAKNEVRARKGAYLPFVDYGAAAEVEKSSKYTRNGAIDANTEITPGKKIPEILPNYGIGLSASWEVDIWKKLRNYKKAAVAKYLASVEGKNFMVTNLIAEIANSYYELLALDNQLEILKRNIEIYQNSLEIVKLEKQSARVTELAVKRFEAELLRNQSRQFYIMQQITETENRINFLAGRFPQKVERDSKSFSSLESNAIQAGIPFQLLSNRPDIKQAEQELMANKLDLKATKAEFYPSLMIKGGVGYQAFNASYLFSSPQSILFSMAGELVGPLVNRNAIKANYYSANSRQIQAIYQYEQTILNAHIEVANQLSNIDNLQKSYELKEKQVLSLNEAIDIAIVLFKSARADYYEVLMTQRDALESTIELIETKKQQMNAKVNIYRALGGGWE